MAQRGKTRQRLVFFCAPPVRQAVIRSGRAFAESSIADQVVFAGQR
jgi:hypothetical protein